MANPDFEIKWYGGFDSLPEIKLMEKINIS
jgi:hypothetical protein